MYPRYQQARWAVSLTLDHFLPGRIGGKAKRLTFSENVLQ
jgi:hypothetical protein